MMKRYEVVGGADEHNLNRLRRAPILFLFESKTRAGRVGLRQKLVADWQICRFVDDGDNARCGYIFRAQEPVAVKGIVGIVGVGILRSGHSGHPWHPLAWRWTPTD